MVVQTALLEETAVAETPMKGFPLAQDLLALGDLQKVLMLVLMSVRQAGAGAALG